MHARFLLAASGLAVTFAQDIFSGCLNFETTSCNLTPLFEAGEDVAAQCSFWTSISTDPCTERCSEEDKELLAQVAAITCDFPEIPTDPYEPELPSGLEDLLSLIPSCASECELGDDQSPDAICNALTSCEAGCEDEIDVALLESITDAICALGGAVPENPECAANCVDLLFGSDPTDVCGNAEATLECIVAECTDPNIVDLFQGIADQACALPEPPTCATECQSALPDGQVEDPNALPCDTATDFASCLDTSCGSEDPLTDLANQLKDVACSLPPLPELPEIPTDIPMCVSDCVQSLPTDPTQLCEGMGSFSQCVNMGCGEEEIFAVLAVQLEQLACEVEPPACAFNCAEDVDPTPPTSADAICSSLTDTTNCLDEECNEEPIFKFVFDAATGIACDIAAIPTELPVCAEDCINQDLVDTDDICAAVEENFVCIEVACGEEYDVVLDLLDALREFGCSFDEAEPTPPAPTPAPQVAEAKFVLQGASLATQFSVETFENALSSASGADVEVESVAIVSAVTLSGADFDGVFTEEQQTQCREGYAASAGLSVDLVVILDFSFQRRRLNAGDLTVEIQATSSPDGVDALLQSTADSDSLLQNLVSAGLDVTSALQELETVTPKVMVSSAEGGLEQVLDDPNFSNNLQSELAQGGLDVDNIETSFEINESSDDDDDDDEWELYVIIAVACVGTALLAGGVGMFIGSRRNAQKDVVKSAEMRSSKAEPSDMF
jgi:hypothetical protein